MPGQGFPVLLFYDNCFNNNTLQNYIVNTDEKSLNRLLILMFSGTLCTWEITIFVFIMRKRRKAFKLAEIFLSHSREGGSSCFRSEKGGGGKGRGMSIGLSLIHI